MNEFVNDVMETQPEATGEKVTVKQLDELVDTIFAMRNEIEAMDKQT